MCIQVKTIKQNKEPVLDKIRKEVAKSDPKIVRKASLKVEKKSTIPPKTGQLDARSDPIPKPSNYPCARPPRYI